MGLANLTQNFQDPSFVWPLFFHSGSAGSAHGRDCWHPVQALGCTEGTGLQPPPTCLMPPPTGSRLCVGGCAAASSDPHVQLPSGHLGTARADVRLKRPKQNPGFPFGPTRLVPPSQHLISLSASLLVPGAGSQSTPRRSPSSGAVCPVVALSRVSFSASITLQSRSHASRR